MVFAIIKQHIIMRQSHSFMNGWLHWPLHRWLHYVFRFYIAWNPNICGFFIHRTRVIVVYKIWPAFTFAAPLLQLFAVFASASTIFLQLRIKQLYNCVNHSPPTSPTNNGQITHPSSIFTPPLHGWLLMCSLSWVSFFLLIPLPWPALIALARGLFPLIVR